MIEIHQQKIAAALTVAIQILVVGGLIACIIVGTQEQPVFAASPDAGALHAAHLPGSTSPAAHLTAGHRPEGVPPGIVDSFRVPVRSS